MKILKFPILVAAVALMTLILAVACSRSDPEALDLPITIKSGVMDPETIKVKQGDMVTLKILADEGGEDGGDVEVAAAPGRRH